MRQGLCSLFAHLWATSDSARRSKERGPFMRQGLCSQLAHLWDTFVFAPPPLEKRWGPPRVRGVM